MKDLKNIVDISAQIGLKNPCLATVIRTHGSSHRTTGSRMLILSNRQCIGAIQGGALEADVIDHALRVLRSGQAKLITYDTGAREEFAEGASKMEVLLEPVQARNSAGHLLAFAQNIFSHHSRGVAATIISLEGKAKCAIGQRMMIEDGGMLTGDIAEPSLKRHIIKGIRDVLRTGVSRAMKHTFSGVTAEVFYEFFEMPPPLTAFGRGYDAHRMSHPLKELCLVSG